MSNSNSKRIAKNTLLLYVRMIFLMGISLYSSRIILDSLGFSDYGVYDVVGGFVALFSLLCGALSTAISRFLTFELGKNNTERLSAIFSTSVNIQLFMAFIVILIAETIGIWFLNSKMVIPQDRLYAANWVFQLAILTFCIQLVSVPYNAAIIAHERMKAFAYIGIFESLGRLFIAYCIMISPIDKLIFYSLMLALLQIIVRTIYGVYCNKHFYECRYHLFFDKILLFEMFGFAGWTFIGSSAIHLRDQGGNIIINLFFGPTVNAARGVANQINTAIQQFVTNFMTALYPQITKSYACGDISYMFKLVYGGARYSFYILLLLAAPIILNSHYLLGLWLKEVPELTDTFVKLFLILAMSESLSNTIVTAQSATGKIRNYQLIVGGVLMLNLPIVYYLFELGFHPVVSVIVAIVISQICLFLRLYLFKKNVDFPIQSFIKEVYLNVIWVTFFSVSIPFLISTQLSESFISVVLLTLSCWLTTSLSIFYVGCKENERLIILNKIKALREKIK